MPDLAEAVRRRLRTAADPVRAARMRAYMKSPMPFLGVAATPLRLLCREVYDAERLADCEEWRRGVLGLWDGARYREERYAALHLVGHRFYRSCREAVESLDLYRHLVVTGAWWDLVDGVASNRVGPLLRGRPDAVEPVIRSWAVSDDLWLRRTALLCQLGSKDATDRALLRFVLEQNLEGSPFGREFFIRKAVGWALRQFARTDPGWVRRFVAERSSQLSGLSRREALRHVDAPPRP